MIPTSIDGTDITGATIDGTDVTEITVDGDTVFTAGPTIIDDFESGNLNAYQGNLNNYTLDSGASAIDGNFSLRTTARSSEAIYSLSGLANYPERGDTFEFKVTSPGGDNNQSGMLFGVQSNPNNNYYAQVGRGDFRFIKDKNVNDDSGTILTLDGSGLGASEPYRCVVDWGQSTITVNWFDANDNNLVTQSVNDTTYSSGGIGWSHIDWTNTGSGNNAGFDSAVIL